MALVQGMSVPGIAGCITVLKAYQSVHKRFNEDGIGTSCPVKKYYSYNSALL